ncbi:MAG: peptidylprolyl isomerase [Bacteroidales bacterium]|nr:peptidylprolyl isomerase [Bacteroidales bacterium]
MKKYLILCFLMAFLLSCSSKKDYRVRMYTTAGNIDLLLYNETPAHRDNFVRLVEEAVYDSLLFHRVIKDFMIQGGDPTSKNAPRGAMLGEGDLGYKVAAEIMPSLHFHKRGALAAAREGDDVNPEKASSASQFYIVWGKVFTAEQLQQMRDFYNRRTGDTIPLTPQQLEAYTTIGGTPHLDGGYTVFGEVVEGLDVVEAIQNVRCDAADRPLEDVRIIKMELLD